MVQNKINISNSSFWNDQTTTAVSAKDLEDLNGLVQTMDKAEIKSLCTENPELVSDYLLALYSGYDLSDQKDCQLYFDETSPSVFDDTKPYSKKRSLIMKKKRLNLKYKTFDNILMSEDVFKTLKSLERKNRFRFGVMEIVLIFARLNLLMIVFVKIIIENKILPKMITIVLVSIIKNIV